LSLVVEETKQKVEEMMKREGLKFYYRAVVRPLFVIPPTEKEINIESLQKKFIESILKHKDEYKCFDNINYLKKMIKKNPSYRVALRLTGKKIEEEAENEVDVGEPLLICEPPNALYVRVKLLQFMGILETITTLFGKHSRYKESVKWLENEINEFLRRFSKYKTEFKIDVLDDNPTLSIEVKVWR